jgi:hypothetical protein
MLCPQPATMSIFAACRKLISKTMTRSYLILFFFVNLLLAAWWLDSWNNANTTSRALPIVAWYEQGNLQIDKYHELTLDKALINEHYYTDKAPLPTFLVLPVFGLIKELGWVKEQNGSLYGPEVYIVGSFVVASLVFALLVLLTFLAIRNIKSSVSPVFLATMPFYASFVFVYSGTFYAHLLSSVFILAGYLFIRQQKYLPAGLMAGAAFLSEYTLALFFPVWALQIWYNERSFFKGFLFGLGTMPAIIFIAVYNYTFTGSPLEMLYKYHTFEFLHTNYGFALPTFKSIWGLTFSHYRGLFFYAPFLLMVFFFVVKSFRSKVLFRHYLFYISIIFFLFIAAYDVWWGGWCYGPRLLFPVAVLLIYEGIRLVANKKVSPIIFWTITGFGLAGAFMAKITILYSIPTEAANPFPDVIVANIIKGNFNPNNIVSMLTGVAPFWGNILWLATFAGGMVILQRVYSLSKEL